MNTPVLSYRGRTVTAVDLEAIRALLAAHPKLSRRAFSQRPCEHWDWRQPSGVLRDMMARSLLLALHRAGHITLPPVRHQPLNNAIARCRPVPVALDTGPLAGALREVQPLDLVAVRRTPQEGLYAERSLMVCARSRSWGRDLVGSVERKTNSASLSSAWWRSPSRT